MPTAAETPRLTELRAKARAHPETFVIGTLGCRHHWQSARWGLCGYCASPGRRRRPLDAPDAPSGYCLACGDELEPIRCVPGQPCEYPHEACEQCGFAWEPCFVCHGEGVPLGGCTFCHGTGRLLDEHCCGCRQTYTDGLCGCDSAA